MSITRWLIIVAMLLLPTVSEAAIAFVSTTDGASTQGITTQSTSVVVPSGTDRFMAVCVTTAGNGGAVPTGLVFNTSETLTKIRSDTRTSGGGVKFISSLWYLINPTVTTANVVTTWASTSNNDRGVGVTHVLFTGVAQSSPIDAQAGATGIGTTLSAVITTASDGATVMDCAIGDHSAGLTIGAGQTSRTNRIVSTFNNGEGVSTVDVKSPAGAETMDWTQASADWAISTASFVPSGGAAPPPQAPTTATLYWKNGTDNVGVTTATIKRCTGASCTPTTTLTVVPATSGTSQSYVDATLAANTTYNWSVCNGDLAGNQSTCTLFTSGATTGTTYRRVLATDDFNRSDNTDLNGNWDAGYTAFNALKIVSNRVRSTTLNTDSLETYNAVSTPNDQWVQATAPTLTGAVGASFNLVVRWANAATASGYMCGASINTNAFGIYKVTTGTFVQLGSLNTTATVLPTDIYRCEAQGTTLRFFQVRGTAETLLVSTTDATYASGKTGVDVFLATGGNLANSEMDNFTMGDFTTTAPTPPSIDAVTVDATGANVTWNLTTPPTQIRVDCGNNTRNYYNDTQPLASFPGGRYTHTWLGGLTFCGFHAIDALGLETTLPTSAYQYADMTKGASAALDTVPPVVSGCLPTTDLPFGTTSYTMSCNINKPAQCAYDSTDIAYSSMTGTMTTQSLQCSALISGLTNGSTTTKYVRAESADSLDGLYPTTSSQTVTLHVLSGAGADTTAPTTVANLVATLDASGLMATLVWTAATDAGGLFGYQVYQSTDACVTPVLAGAPVTTTSIQLNLVPNTAYCWTVKAIDNANNLSAAMSNQATLTTRTTIDVIPPSTMGTITLVPYQNSIVLLWPDGTDESGAVTSSIEYCAVIAPSADCSNFQQFVSLLADTSISIGLTSNTSYCFRGRHTDSSGNIGAYSGVFCGMTLSSGIGLPRGTTDFGFTPAVPATRATYPGTRPTRP